MAEGENQFYRLSESSPDAIYVAIRGHFAYLNPAAVRLFGAASAAELLGQPALERIHPRDRTIVGERMRRLAAGAEGVPLLEETYLRLDGSPVAVEVSAVPFRYDDEAATLVFVRDVTERRMAQDQVRALNQTLECRVAERTRDLDATQQQLREALALNEAILMSSAMGIAAYRQDGRCVRVNPAFAETVGGPQSLILSQNFRQLASWQESGLLEMAEAVLASGAGIEREIEITTTFGRHLWLHCQMSRFESQGEPHLLAVIHDVTEERQAKQTLEEREREFRSLADNVPDNVLRCDCQGRRLYVNRALEDTLGRSAAELIGSPIEPDGPYAELGQAILRVGITGKSMDLEQATPAGVGGPRIHSIRIVPEPGPDGRPAKVLAVGRDVTDQKRVEEDLRRIIASLRQAEDDLAAARAEAERANLAKSKFLAAASHDLRQPVQSLMLLLDTLKDNASTPTVTRVARVMDSALEGLSGLLGSILDISKLDAGVVIPEMLPYDVGGMLDRLCAEYASAGAKKGLRLRCHCRSGLVARTDPAMLERLVRNLIENAMRYTTVGGLLVATRRRGDRLRIDVVDSGIGIPSDKQSVIFEEFYQVGNPGRNREHGLGLGLAIVQRLARLIGAELQVRSTLGKGSRFSVLIPLDAATHAGSASHSEQGSLAGQRILVIEDNPTVQKSLKLILQAWNCEAITAATGDEALAVGAQCGWNFGAIIADFRLGAGLTGVEAATEIRRCAGRSVPTVVVTGDTAPERISEVHASGFEMLHKPVAPKELKRTLARLLAAAGQATP